MIRLIEGTIIGRDDDRLVYVDHTPVSLEKSLRVRRMSPTGFAWGYEGSGPAQLALAILLQTTGDEWIAERYFQDFKRAFIARQPVNGDFAINVDIDAWLAENGLKIMTRQEIDEAIYERIRKGFGVEHASAVPYWYQGPDMPADQAEGVIDDCVADYAALKVEEDSE